jgi:NTP pyrophosphatase (non-canonical NTP hydrolase)|tara:strand:- start:167 stop:556 length:390 start_codon:yes stop_codon:yes gene_type:complete
MKRPLSVEDWISIESGDSMDGLWKTMMSRVAIFHSKHSFSSVENNGHDMGYRIALTVEELGEFAAAITKGKPDDEIAEELADLMILILGHSLALEIDLEKEFHSKMDIIMQRPSRKGGLGIRVTDYNKE